MYIVQYVQRGTNYVNAIEWKIHDWTIEKINSLITVLYTVQQ